MPAPTIVKKALLVGVRYKGGASTASHGLAELPGTHKDVARFATLLTETYDYNAKDITILIDADGTPRERWPTKHNIMTAMKSLVEGRRRGDHIVFMYSGHGAQTDALNDKKEEDGKDEILLPMDCKIDPRTRKYANFIRDDTIRGIFVDGVAKGVRCTLIFDCCHSGTACDLPNVELASPTSPTLSPVIPSPVMTRRCSLGNGAFAQMETLHHEHAEKSDTRILPGILRDDRTLVKQVTSWSACRDGEITYSTENGGIFIDAFIKTLQREGNRHPTHRKLLQEIRKRLVDAAARNRENMIRRNIIPVFGPGGFQVNDLPAAPRPQLGSLQPRTVLNERFAL